MIPSSPLPNNSSSSNVESGLLKMSLHQRETPTEPLILHPSGFCNCGITHSSETMANNSLIPSPPVLASRSDSSQTPSPMEMLKKIHPPRAGWYEQLYASALKNCTKSYEAEIASYKSQLFSQLRGQAKEVVEIGIGTGPNLKYYVTDTDMHVIGIDPIKKMEKYAREAAEAAGLSPANFEFIHAVGEGLPLGDASVDAVIATLVLCSVKDVDRTLKEVKRVLRPGGLFVFMEHVVAKEGTLLRFVQNILNPVQKLVADGCHLTRETGSCIDEAGFSSVDSSMTRISKALCMSPHIYGTARK